jgi:hypothetical protein
MAMTSLLERIKRGKMAIAEARAAGRDTGEWEVHLAKLERRARLGIRALGITAADVLRVFPGARVVVEPEIPEADWRAIQEEAAHWVWKDGRWQRANWAKPESACCSYCDKPHVPGWRRGGRVGKRVWPDGHQDLCCHFCGREVRMQ